jgi:hypothetical protein
MVKILSSTTLQPRHLKLLLWGETATRKTESILRYFPDVLLIDTEGNAAQCVGMPEIPEFLLAQTKDVHEVIQIVDEVAAGRHRFPDGRPVQTLAIDSISVLWAIRKDARSLVAEQRSQRWGKSAEEATMTQLDWSMAKRPLLRLNTRLANCPIKFVIYTARLQDRYQDDPKQRDRLVKVGEGPDALRGLEYDMNLALRMRTSPDGQWECQVTKVQGALGQQLPLGKTLKRFPAEEILRHTGQLTGKAGAEQDVAELVEVTAKRELAEERAAYASAGRGPRPVSSKESALDLFYTAAANLGYRAADGSIDRTRIHDTLKAGGYKSFKPENVGDMLSFLREASPVAG